MKGFFWGVMSLDWRSKSALNASRISCFMHVDLLRFHGGTYEFQACLRLMFFLVIQGRAAVVANELKLL